MNWLYGNFAAGRGVKVTAANDADGATFELTPGTYRLHVYGEPVWIVRSATACADGSGTRLPADQTEIVRVFSTENWAVRSAGGTGIVELTESGSGTTGL
ncbi:MAG TPA: hypothetical protein VEA99_12475 [Gemmatimonadaceae bacterium]|nr:hypothetical protein [Gemmatimonadaceae bacterium]